MSELTERLYKALAERLEKATGADTERSGILAETIRLCIEAEVNELEKRWLARWMERQATPAPMPMWPPCPGHYSPMPQFVPWHWPTTTIYQPNVSMGVCGASPNGT